MRGVPARLAALVLVAAAACSGGSDTAAPPPTTAPPPTEAPSTSTPRTTAPPTTIERGAPRTTTTVAVGLTPGAATITGTVNGPGGPVDGATVKIERLVGKEVASTEVRSAGGAYTLASVLGGAYRVRAWRAPDLAQNGTEVFFLGANEVKRVDLTLSQYGANGLVATVDPNPPKVDETTTLTVRLGAGRVDDDGRVTTTPRGGIPLALSVGQGAVLESPPQVITDPAGGASWRLRCTAPGTLPVTIAVGTTATSVAVPPCEGR